MKKHFIPVFCSAAFIIALLTACETQRNENFPPDSYIDSEPESSIPVVVNPGAEDTTFVVPSNNIPQGQPGKVSSTQSAPVISIDPVPTTTTQPVATKKPANDGSVIYKVRKNDSLWSISMTYGVSVDELAKANGLDKNKPLKIDQTLVIPANAKNAVNKPIPSAKSNTTTTITTTQTTTRTQTTTTVKTIPPKVQPKAGESLYVVKPGDSLSVIAAKHHVKTNTLAKANNITDKNAIRAGQTLVIPVADASSTTTSSTPAKATTSSSSTPKTTSSSAAQDKPEKPATVGDPKKVDSKPEGEKPADVKPADADMPAGIILPFPIEKATTVEQFLKDNNLDLPTFKKINPDFGNLAPTDVLPAGSTVNFLVN